MFGQCGQAGTLYLDRLASFTKTGEPPLTVQLDPLPCPDRLTSFTKTGEPPLAVQADPSALPGEAGSLYQERPAPSRDGKTSLVDYRTLSFFCFRFF